MYKVPSEVTLYKSTGLSEPGGDGGGGGMALPIIADQLTLSQPGGQIMPTTLLLAPPPRIFRPSYGLESQKGNDGLLLSAIFTQSS